MMYLSHTPVNQSDTCQILSPVIRKEHFAKEVIMKDDSPKETHSSWLLEGIFEAKSKLWVFVLDLLQGDLGLIIEACLDLNFSSDKGELKKKKKRQPPLVPSISWTYSEQALKNRWYPSRFLLMIISSFLAFVTWMDYLKFPHLLLWKGSAINFMHMKTIWPDVTEQDLDVELI